MSISAVVDLLACPRCGSPLVSATDGRAVACPHGHSFDLARQGYLNLLGGPQPGNADTTAMVGARDRFLSGGHYAPIADRLRALASRETPDVRLLDAGTGTGYYLAAMLEQRDARGIGLDVSVAACRKAARAHPRLGAVVADIWQGIPVGVGLFDVVSCVFAPRNAAEFCRVLKPGGRLIVVHPEPEHLAELRGALGLLSIEDAKADRLAHTMAGRFHRESTEALAFEAGWDRQTLTDLVQMGPNAFHVVPGQVERGLQDLPLSVMVTVAVTISVWAPLPP